MIRRVIAVVVLIWGITTALSPVVLAQDTPPTVITAPHIIPRPNSGQAPTEAGDRGGALQLVILGGVVLAIGGAGMHLVRESRRARAETR